MLQRAHTTISRKKALLHTFVRWDFVVCALMTSTAFAQPLNVIWDRSGAGDSSRYGYTILPLGDQNNDGLNDWAVLGLGNGGSWHGTQRSYIEFFHGGNPPDTAPYMTAHGNYVNWSGAANVLGDVNGDTYVDWFTRTQITAAYDHLSVHFGGPNADTTADVTMTIGVDDEFGTVGDFNGDGFSDLYWLRASTATLHVIYGGNPMDTIPDWPSGGNPSGSQAVIWAHGDLNEDGYSDFVSVGISSSTTFIFLGGASPDTIPAYTWPGTDLPQDVVRSINGDQFDDLVLHARETGPVCFGGPLLHSLPDVTLTFPCAQSSAHAAISAGDFNHDGYQDLILLTDYCEDNIYGVLSFYLGHPWLNPQPAFTVEGWTAPLNLVGIWTAAGLGDVNGDGIDDIAIGALDEVAYLGWRGRCIILAGDTSYHAAVNERLVPHPSSLDLSSFPNPFNPTTTISFALPRMGNVKLNVLDITGRLIETLADKPFTAGDHSLLFDGSALPSGIYFARLQAGDYTRTQKMVLLK